MNIDIKDLITLNDNNKYVVVSKALYDSKNYFFLLDINNDTNIKFCYLDNNELVESEDKTINTNLLKLFYETAKNSLENQ